MEKVQRGELPKEAAPLGLCIIQYNRVGNPAFILYLPLEFL